MQNAILDDLEGERSEETESQTHDNAWRLESMSEVDFSKLQAEKEHYDEVIEYIREVDEILNLIRPYPREDPERIVESQQQDVVMRSDSLTQSSRLDHLEKILKLVEQLKELQENDSRLCERSYLKDLKKLREHKRRLKDEELELRNRSRTRSTASPEDFHDEVIESLSKSRKISSTASEKLEHEVEGWQHKRKSLCLPFTEVQNKGKVSKWTKVKEAFHWEKTSLVSKPSKKELYCLQLPGEREIEAVDYSREQSQEDEFLRKFSLTHFPPPSPPLPLPPPPPPPPLPPKTHSSCQPENLLSVRPLQDFPSSSSSDRLDEVFSDTLPKGNKTPDGDASCQGFVPGDNDDGNEILRKSSSGELLPHLSKEELTSRTTKSNKTTWGKVKDIIQTRKDSLKKKPKKRGSDEFKKRRKLSTSQFSDQFEDLSSPEDKHKNVAENIPKPGFDFPEDAQHGVEEKCPKKLMPALTLTLPSTEELRSLSCEDLDKRGEVDDEKVAILDNFGCQAQYCEDKSKFTKGKSGQNQRLSRWVKVKRVFLTSGSPSRPSNYSPGNDSSPTSQNKSSGFFSDMESDDVSSGEWIDDKSPTHEKPRIGGDSEVAMTLIQDDIRKSYNELQKKLSQEFDQKLRDWEMKIGEGSGKLDENSPKSKGGEDGDSIPKFRKTRDSMAVPLPNLNDLSPEFKKKLNDWKKMKTSQSSSSVSSSATKEDIHGQNIKIKIGEWQPWRSRCSQKSTNKSEDMTDDFSKKSEEGQKLRSRPPSSRRKDKEGDGSTWRRDSKRRDSEKKSSHSRTSSGGDSLVSISSTDKDNRSSRRSQKMKDYQWVEKELQKIEREKLRLEQEKEKYLEREARLEKMKRTMGTASTQEVLIRTPAGFFRFKGISQKFTKKLYEWEKARGIAPEASTFALLEESAKTNPNGDVESEGVVPLQRSKSTGSVPELPSSLIIQTMAHHPSSLSLNDVDDFKTRDEPGRLDDSESCDRIKAGSEEPEAIIVDVEDIVEETARLDDLPPFQTEIPVYTYAQQETDRVIETVDRFSLSDSGQFIRPTKATTSNRNIEVFDCEKDSKMTFRKTSQIYEMSESVKRSSFADDPEISLKENTAEVTDAKAQGMEKLKELPVDLSQSSVVDINRGFDSSEEDMGHFKGNISIGIPSLSKSPKTFFEWSTHSEIGESSTRSLISESYGDWKASSNISKTSMICDTNLTRSVNDPEELKKKIKEKITLMQRMSTERRPLSWKQSEYDFEKRGESRRHIKIDVEEKRTIDSISGVQQHKQEKTTSSESSTSVSVFVPTTRKIISPVQTSSGVTPSVYSYVIDDVKSEDYQEKTNVTHTVYSAPHNKPQAFNPVQNLDSSSSAKQSESQEKKNEIDTEKKRDIGIPPLPNSPKSFKKLNAKETAPSIRMIIAKYNQKISERDSETDKKNESGSPKMWRSPVFGRRTQEKIDQYTRNGEVQKSASLDNMRSIPQASTPPQANIKGILKSSSVGIMKIQSQGSEDSPDIRTYSSTTDATKKENGPSALRALKIQKAKEEFLSGRVGSISSDTSATSPVESRPDPIQLPTTSKAQVEIRVEDSDHSLTKSVSEETITGSKEPTPRESTSQESRPLQKSSSKFDISSIKSKFRKIRMRKEKDPKLNAVAVLCRQSLFIEVPKSSDSSQPSTSMSKSCPSSPVMDRNRGDKSQKSRNKKPK